MKEYIEVAIPDKLLGNGTFDKFLGGDVPSGRYEYINKNRNGNFIFHIKFKTVEEGKKLLAKARSLGAEAHLYIGTR